MLQTNILPTSSHLLGGSKFLPNTHICQTTWCYKKEKDTTFFTMRSQVLMVVSIKTIVVCYAISYSLIGKDKAIPIAGYEGL
jgi:hypothetical protein